MVRVHAVSDVHGRVDGLARAGDGADLLLCLGDLACMIDYRDHGNGVLGRLFGADAVGRFVRLRAERRYDEARAHVSALWESLGENRNAIVDGAVGEQYAELLAALATADCPVLLTYGNVDRPALLRTLVPDGIRLLDGETATVAGLTVGLVGGGLPGPVQSSGEVATEVYARRVAAVGGCDVLGAHLPPHLPELVYDRKARRFERGATQLLDAVREHQPAALVFGHVHSPLRTEVTIGRTPCRNAGHFHEAGVPAVLEV